MAVISKIRNYTGLLIAVIGIGLAAFVLGDFLGYGPMRQQRVDVGKADGNAITYMHFENRVQQQISNWQQQTGQSAGPREAFQMRNQVWNEMLREILMEDIFESLGIDVTAEELFNMIHSNDPPQVLRQSFADPMTGQYDPQQVTDFLRNFNQLDPSIRTQWLRLEEFMKQDRREGKYHTLIGNGFLVPAQLATSDFISRNTTADIRFVYKPHADLDTEDFTVSERELRRVYDENKHRFKQDASRSITFVSLPVFPSDEDRENTLNDLLVLQDELAQAPNIASFINAMSDRRFDPTFHAPGSLSPQIDPEIFDMPVGSIIGPYMEDNAYILAMLVDAQLRPDSMRASHILIAYQGSAASNPDTSRGYEEAQQMADSLLQVVQSNPGRFATLATQLSDDPSAAMNQGDLDWFNDGAMVPPFNEAVVENPTGTFLTVETDFGFHVVHVTGKSALNKKVQVAQLVRNIEPGSRTYRNTFERVSEFAAGVRKADDFAAAAEEAGLSVRQADRLGAMDMSLPGIEQGRGIVQWAFDEETRTGDVSRIFELEDLFVIAKLNRKQDAGIPSLDQIRQNITDIAISEQKKAKIAEEMQALMDGRSLDDIAAALELDVQEAQNLSFNSRNIPGVGPEPTVIGTLFAGLDQTKKGPIKGNNGVFILEVTRMDETIAPEDLTQARQTLHQTFKNRVPGQAFDAIKDNARIEDNRAWFF